MAAYAWQQLTELVAAVVGVPLVWHECLDEYSDKRNGAAFDPVRVDEHASMLAHARRITVRRELGYALASFSFGGAEFMIAEYDQYNDGDALKSFRLAVCRAILQQAEATQ